MSKSLCALVHKPGSSPEAFQRYYEDNHAPLAIGLFPFSGYVRNHLVDGQDFGWDTISEFWSDDMAQTAALMEGPIGETMRADEERFMDRARIAPGGAEEHELSPGAPADEQSRRTCILLDRHDAGIDLQKTARDWAASLARGLDGVSLDFVTSWSSTSFPAEAVIWLPGWPEATDAPSGLSVRALRVLRHETPKEKLLTHPS